ncbi:protein translocase subunit SecD [Candidatus Peribacteria bacterium]|nr:protein translocase subunit SecD [Candidatus Peribacteria bacterium]
MWDFTCNSLPFRSCMSPNRSLLRSSATLFVAAILIIISLPQEWRSGIPLLRWPSIHYGLDLAGGTQLDFRISEQEMLDQRAALEQGIEQANAQGASVETIGNLEMQVTALDEQQRNVLEAIRTVLERRINSLGVSEATITPSVIGNEKHLLVECPGVVDVQQCIATVGKTIKLEFKEEYTEATAEYRAGVEKSVRDAQRRLSESGITLAALAEDMSGKLGVISLGEQLYFKSTLPKGLEDLWNLSPKSGVQRREATITVPSQDEQGNPTEKMVDGIFLSEITRAKTQTGRTVNEAPTAFTLLQRSEDGVKYVEHIKGPLAASTSPRIVGTLRAMKAGELKAVAMDDGTSRVLFLRTFIPGSDEAHVSHILVAYKGATQAASSVTRTKEQAAALARELKVEIAAGASFEQIAKTKSDADSASRGGKMEAVARGTISPGFEQVAFSQDVGTVSDPVETQYGYHIIRTDAPPSTSADMVGYDELIIAADPDALRAGQILADLQAGRVRSKEEAVTLRSIFFSLEPTGWKDTALDGKHFRSATVTLDPVTNIPVVQILFDEEGGRLFQELTKRNVGKRLAIFVGGDLISAPVVQGEISGGSAVITGSQNFDEARLLAQDLNTGAIPAPIFLAGQRTVEATLGADALRTSMQASAVGIVLLMIYMLLVYRMLGALANIALTLYTLLYFVMMKLPLFLFSGQYVVLTLAGMAGIILSTGMAVDANVLIFERIKEELRRGRSFALALETGFEKAWPSIRDGNVSTLITCSILFMIGTSIVRGFAITLGLGVFLSMFTAITVTKWLARKVAATPLAERTELFGVKRSPPQQG